MNLNSSSSSKGMKAHAFLSPSRYHWVRYSPDKLRESYLNYRRTRLGTQLHELAEQLIQLNVRLPDNGSSLNSFVNDAIRLRLEPEQLLYYNEWCFGTADAIGISNGVLTIHDLKTGRSPGSFDQLMIYAALYVLIEGIRPPETVLRIYHNGEIHEYLPKTDEILEFTEAIELATRIIKEADTEPLLAL